MKLLKVPYITQFDPNACGPAVLHMIYEYYDLKNVSQEIIFDIYQELEPHGSGNLRMTTEPWCKILEKEVSSRAGLELTI